MVAYPLPQTSSYMGHASSSVAMVSGLHPAKMNCTRIFNLFCLYGNIEKVRRIGEGEREGGGWPWDMAG